MAYSDRIFNGCINVRDFGILGDPGVLLTQTELNNVFNAAIVNKRPVFFPEGTYVFPEKFTFNFGHNPVVLLGENKYRTIITTKFGSVNTQIVERINLTKPRTQADGYYRIDRIGVNHADWAPLINPDIDDYIKILNGVPSFASFAEVKAAGYLTELDVSQPDPGIDGLYVVAVMDDTITGGGYTHSNLPYNTAVKIVTGTVLQRLGGVWSRVVPGRGFEFGGNFRVENLQFNNVAFYLFTPNNTTIPDFEHYIIKNNIFRHVIRVNSLDRQFASTSIQSQGFMKGLNHHFRDGERFNYQKIEISDNDFSYIHTCIMWECPPTRRLEVVNNEVSDCYTFTEMFIYLPMSSVASVDAEDDEGYTNKTFIFYINNSFTDVRHYSPVSSGGHHMLRGNGKTIFENNRFYDVTGTIFYISGNNNLVTKNTINPYIQSFPTKEALTWGGPAVFHVKTGIQIELSSTIISCNKIERSAMICPFDIKNTDTTLIITDNKVMTVGYAEALLTTDLELNRELLYTLKDVEKFKTLAYEGTIPTWSEGVYVSGSYVIHNGELYICVIRTSGAGGSPDVDTTSWRLTNKDKYVYWDIRRSRWMPWPSVINRQIPIIEKNYDSTCTKTITFSDNVMYGYSLIRMIDGYIKEMTFNDNDIFVERDILYQSVGGAVATAYNMTITPLAGMGSYIETLRLYNNRIYRSNALITTKYYNSIFNLYAANNDFYHGLIGYDIVFKNDCVWTNNHVRPWPKYNSVGQVTLLSLPNSSTTVPIKFRKILPPAWTAKAYAVGAYVSYNGAYYVATQAVLSSDSNPTLATTKWSLYNLTDTDNATLTIQGGSFDATLARYGCVAFEGIKRVSIKDTLFKGKMINDWASMFRPVADGGSSRRYLIAQNTATTIDSLEIENIKTDFDARDNRYLLYTSAATVINNLRINNIIPMSNYSVNKMYYQDTNGTLSIGKANISNLDYVQTDTAFENAIVEKEGLNRLTVSSVGNTSVTLPKSTLTDRIVIESGSSITGLKIGTTNGGAEIATVNVAAGTPLIVPVDIYSSVAQTIYFTVVSGSPNLKIQIFKR